MDIADQPGHPAVAGPPGKNGEGVQVRVEILVRLVDPHEPLDGGAVKHDLVVDRLLDLRRSNGHVLQLAENIGELQANELHILLFDFANDVFLCVQHCKTPLSFFQIKKDKGRPASQVRNAFVLNYVCSITEQFQCVKLFLRDWSILVPQPN